MLLCMRYVLQFHSQSDHVIHGFPSYTLVLLCDVTLCRFPSVYLHGQQDGCRKGRDYDDQNRHGRPNQRGVAA